MLIFYVIIFGNISLMLDLAGRLSTIFCELWLTIVDVFYEIYTEELL